jgi:hypothetical protein
MTPDRRPRKGVLPCPMLRPSADLLPLALSGLLACQPGDGLDTGLDDSAPPAAPRDRLLILCADQLAEVAGDYAAYRASTGWDVELVSMVALQDGSTGLAAGVGAEVVRAHRELPEGLELVVLIIGDASVDEPESAQQVPLAVGPLGYLGDTGHVDVDGDGVPDLATGRLPFDEPEQVVSYLERVQRYESEYLPGSHNRSVALFTGEGGFGEVIDGVLEYVAGQVVEQLSYDFDFSVTTNIPGSAYYLPQDAWHEEFARQYNQGHAYQPYLGHTVGEVRLDLLEDPGRRGLLAFYSCSDGAVQDEGGPSASLSEQLLEHPHGPMAVVGATTISHPYGNAVLAREMSLGVLNERVGSYGALLRQAKDDMVYGADEFREQLDVAASVFIDGLPEIITSHVTMYMLLGDPCLSPRLPPGVVLLDEPEQAFEPGAPASVTGVVSAERDGEPFEGEVLITLEVMRSTVIHELNEVDEDCSDLDACLENVALANDHLLASVQGPVLQGRFELELELPASLPDSEIYYLRALAWDSRDDATGFVEVDIAP